MSKTDHIIMPEDHMDELYHSSNPLVRFAHNERLRLIADVVPARGMLTVLDAGCGEGHLIALMHERMPTLQYYGVDVTAVAIEGAKKRCPFAAFSVGDLGELKFPDGFFDVVVATEVLEHIFEYREVLRELTRVIKPEGVLILTFPNEVLWTASRFLLGRRPIKVPDHVNSFTPIRMAKAVGLPVLYKRNLPFRLPFWASLGSLMKFRKV